MNQTFMKEKPVFPLVVSMALPMTISMLVNALYNIVDSYFVAKISEDAMTALSLVFPVQNLVTAVGVGVAIGINAVIAFYLGAQEQEHADKTASLGVFLNAIHGLILTIVCIGFMKSFLGMFTNSSSIIGLGLNYSYITMLFCVPLTIGVSYEKIFQSVGRMKVSMVAMACGCIANIILDPIMIFGIGFVPAMGIRGAAIATGIGQLISLGIYLVMYRLRPIPVKISWKYMKMDKNLIKRIYSIGIPASLNMALPSFLITALNGILASFSQSYVLVLGAYYKLQTFLYLTGNGVLQGMRPLIGYNYGAGEYKRVRKIFETGLGLIASVMVIGTVLCLAIPAQLIGIFTANQETIAYGVTALRIISIGFVASTVSVTVSGALEGLGKGVESLVINVLRYIAIILPIAWGLSQAIGANGVWHAFWITEIIMAVISYVIYRRTTKFTK